MKKLFTPNVIMIVIIVLTMFFLSSCAAKEKKNYKYKVIVQSYNNSVSDYTNYIEYLPNGGIKYTDEHGYNVTRYGSITIVENK